MAFMILAFAYPFIPASHQEQVTEGSQCILFLDNSLSMAADGKEGPLLEAAKNRARALVKQMPAQMTFLLLTHDKDRIAEQKLSKPEILDEIDRIGISSTLTEEEEIYRILNDLSKEGDMIAVISDFRKGAFSTWTEPLSSNPVHYWLKVPAVHHPNVSIDSAWFETPRLMPDQSVTLMIKMTNHGQEDFEKIPCKLEIEGQIRGVANADIKAGESKTINIVFNTGSNPWNNAIVSIPGDDITYDDKLHFSFPVNKGSKGLLVSSNIESERYVKAVLTEDAGFNLKTAAPVSIQFSELKGMDFIVLNEISEMTDGFVSEIQQFVSNGGNLIVFPHPTDNAANNKLLNLLQQPVFGTKQNRELYTELWNLNDPFLSGIFEKKPNNPDLPFVNNYFDLSGGIRVNAFWKLKNNQSFMTRGTFQIGLVFVSAVSLSKEFSNLQVHPLFIPVLLRMASYKDAEFQLYYATGTEEMIPLQNIDLLPRNVLKLRSKEKELIPELISRGGKTFINVYGELQQPGHYELIDANNKTLYQLAFNHTRKKSVTEPEKNEILLQRATGLNATILTDSPQALEAGFNEISKGKPLWKWFIVAAIFCLFLEILLIRYWKA